MKESCIVLLSLVKICNKIIVSEEIHEALFGGTVLKEGWSLDGSE